MSSVGVDSQSIEWSLLRSETVTIAGNPVELRSRPRLVILRLLLDANHTVRTDTIADFIWADDYPKSAANSVARFVADLRVALGDERDRIETVPNGYRVNVLDGELDIDIVRVALSNCQRLDDTDLALERCDAELTAALNLVGDDYNPHLLGTVDATHYLTVHDELRLAVVAAYSDVRLQRGRHDDLVALLESVLARRPTNEALWATLMVSLQRSGRTTEALRAGRRARRALSAVGLIVGDRIVEIERELVGVGRDDDRSPTEPDRPYDGIIAAQNRLIGRATELADVEMALQEHPVVSIVGLGGLGKTRLGLGVAHELEASGVEVHRVGLQAITDSALVAPAIATTVGVPSSSTQMDAAHLAHAVRGQSFVLLLDNCEHLVDACREIVDAIVGAAPEVGVLTTTRVPLDAEGEHIFNLGLLASSSSRTTLTPASRLFLERASPHLGRRPTSDDLAGINAIADLLSGHPLAIELAAAQLAEYSIETLLSRLARVARESDTESEEAADTFDALVNWSWDRLAPAPQALLARLATFRSGCTLEAVTSICSEGQPIVDDLAVLVDHGFVTQTGEAPDVRYSMPEAIHRFARDRLADRSAVDVFEDRLVRWLIEVSERWSIAETHVWAEASSDLLVERHNLAAALHRLESTGRKEELAWLAVRSSGMWINHGFAQEVLRWLQPLVDDADCSTDVRSAAAAMLLSASHALGQLDDLTGLAMQSIVLAGGRPFDWIPAVASFMGMWSALSPAPMSSEEFNELARSVARQSESVEVNLALCALYPAHLEFNMRRYDAAMELFATAHDLALRPGRLLLVSEVGLGLSLLMANRRDEARSAVHSWTSRADTDEWHFIVDLFRALIVGSVDDPAAATTHLVASVRGLRPATLWGRADEIQSTFGILAGLRGEPLLSEELLSTVVVRDVMLLGVIAEHLATERGTVDDMSWFTILQDLWTRVLPDDVDDDGDEAHASAGRALAFWTSDTHADR